MGMFDYETWARHFEALERAPGPITPAFENEKDQHVQVEVLWLLNDIDHYSHLRRMLV